MFNYIIHFVRHAESAANIRLDSHLETPDHLIDLSDLGKRQAQNLIIDCPCSYIYHSPYLRAKQTLDLCQKTPFTDKSQIIEEPLVCERRIAWSWGKKEYFDIIKEWRKKGSFWWKGPNHEFESGADVLLRAELFINKICRKHFHRSCTIYVFTHGFFMQMARYALLGDEGMPLDEKRENPENTEIWSFYSNNLCDWKLNKTKNNDLSV